MTLAELLVNLKMNAASFISGTQSALNSWTTMSGSMLAGGAALSAGVTGPLMALGSAAMGMASQLQGAEIGFATMLGSGERAKEFLDELKDFAAKTPFEFKDLVDAAKRMKALGFEAEEVVPTMRSIGNAAAGLGGGAALIDRITLALGQMRAKGKVSAEEMRQLAEAGIPAWEMLAKAIGVDIPQAMKMAESGAVSASAALPAIIGGMNERFGGMMENFSKTVMGQWSNVKDQLGFVLADIGKSLMPLASLLLEKFVIPAADGLRVLAERFNALPEPLKYIAVALAALAAAIGPVLVALGGLGFSLMSVGALLGTTGIAATLGALLPILAGVAAAVAVAAAAWGLWQLDPVKEAVAGLWDSLQNFWESILKPFGEAILNFGNNFGVAAQAILTSGLQVAWEGLTNAAGTLWNWLGQLWEALTPVGTAFQEIVSSMSPVGEAFVAVWDKVKSLIGVIGELVLALGVLIGSQVWDWARAVAYVLGDTLVMAFKGLVLVLGQVWEWAKTLATIVGSTLVMAFKGLAMVVQSMKDLIMPPLEIITKGVQKVVEWITKIPGVQKALDSIAGAYDSLKSKVTSAFTEGSLAAAGFSQAQVDSLSKAKEAVNQARGAYDEILTKFQQGKATEKDLAAAHDALKASQANLNAEMQKAGISVDTVKTALTNARLAMAAAQKQVDEVSQRMKEGKASSTEFAVAQGKLREATQQMTAANDLAKKAAKALGIDVAELTRVTQASTTATVSEKEARRLEKEELKASKSAYDGYLVLKTKMFAETIRHIEVMEKARQAEEDYTNYLRTGTIPAAGENVRAIKAVDAAYREMSRTMDKASTMVPKISAAMEDMLRASRGSSNIDDLRKALDSLGSGTSASLTKAAEAAKKNYEIIKDSGISTPYDIQQAWVKYLEAQKAAALANGQVWTESNEKVLDSAKDTLDKMTASGHDAAKKQKDVWTDMAKQVSTILSDLGRDVAKSFWDLITGGSRRSEANKRLKEEEADLKNSLQERLEEWEQYQVEVSRRQQELTAEYQEYLRQETEEFESAITERRQEYDDYASEVAEKLAEFKTENQADLERDLADLRESLDDRRKEYEDYVEEVQEKLASLHEEYVDDVEDENEKFSRSTEDKKKQFDRENDARRRAIDEKKRDYARDEQDLNSKIQRELALGQKANLQQVEEWRNTLLRKKEDLDVWIAEQEIAASQQAEDYKTWLDRETADHNEAIEERTAKYTEEETALAESLDRRTEEWNNYQAENKAKVDDTIQAHKDALAKEEADLTESLTKRKEALDGWIAERTAAYNADVANAKKRYDDELTALRTSLDSQRAEVDTFKSDVATKLNELKDQYISVWDSIKESFGGILTSMGEAITRFGTEYLMGKLFKWLKDDLLDNILPSVGRALGKVFGGIFGGGGGAGEIISEVPGMITGTEAAVGGVLGTAGQVAGNAGGIAGTVAGIGTGLAGGFVSGGLSLLGSGLEILAGRAQGMDAQRTEENTRFTAIDIHAMADNVMNSLTPTVKLMWDHWTGTIQESKDKLIDIASNTGNFGSLHSKLMDVEQRFYDLAGWDRSNSLDAAQEIIDGLKMGPREINITVNLEGSNLTAEDVAKVVAEELRTQMVGA